MSQDLAEKIRAAAQAKNIDPDIALAIAKAESSMRPSAQAGTSSAAGLFQVVDKTWKEFGGNPKKKLDADENIRVGTDIIAKNTQTLRNLLQRDPRPAEVYAAHYFGPSGARNFLTADPATPIVDILGKAVVKANPNLQGKTAAQVMAQLEKKMGSGPAPAANVLRETSAPPARKPLPPSLPPMASLGPGYQAAMALSFLSGADDKEDKEDKDEDKPREPGVAEKYLAQMQQAPRPLALAEFANISIKSPFAALQPEQPVQMFNKGGKVEQALTPEEIEAASRPATVNPNIRRQGEAARRLAAMRDVNTLPDPRTYAAVSGFLGTPPDELGFSVMHSDREGIKKAGQVGFGVGTALQVAPVVGMAKKAAKMLEDITVGNIQRARIQKAAKDVPSDTAYDSLRERMEAQGNLAYAMRSEKIKDIIETVRNLKGNYGARRVERAADEIPNLEKMYKEKALKDVFAGQNIQGGVITLNPAEFEQYAASIIKNRKSNLEPSFNNEVDQYNTLTDKYIDYLSRLPQGFNEVPYLSLSKDSIGLPHIPQIIGHEGRHRSRALAGRREKASLVKINPRGDLMTELPTGTQEEYIEALKKEIERTGRLVLPEKNVSENFLRPSIKLPEIYAAGGIVRRANGSPVTGEQALTPQQIERLAEKNIKLTGINNIIDFVAQRVDPQTKGLPTSARTLLETVQGGRSRITEANFLPEEIDVMRQLAELKGGQKGSINYADYVALAREMNKQGKVPASMSPGLLSMADPMGNVQTTLGQFRYQRDPKGNLQITDTYDFNPPNPNATQEARTGDYGAFGLYGLIRDYAGERIPPGMGRDVRISLPPVKRADGSPEEGERLTPQQIERIAAQEAMEREAASKPAFLTPKSGIGRKDVPAKPNMSGIELAQQLMLGAGELPYLYGGAAVDLASLALMPFGYKEEKPFLGSEYLKDKATKFGIRAPDTTEDRLKGPRVAAEMLASFTNPAGATRSAVLAAEKGARGAGTAAKMLEDVTVGNIQRGRIRRAGEQVPPDTAYDPLRERMETQGNLALAVRNKATPFAMTTRPDTSVDGFIMSMNRPETLAFREKYPDINFFDEAAMKTTQEYQNFTKPIDQAEYLVKYEMQGNYEQREMLKQDPTLEKWFSKAVPHYLRTEFATPEDPLVKAAEKGLLLHFEPKVLPRNFDPAKVKNPIDQQALAYTRETEGFPGSGMAKEDKTNFAKRVEDKIDSSVYPATLEDISNPAQIPPSLRKFVETRPEERVMDFAPSVLEHLQLPQLRDKMLEIRALGPKGEYSAYSQPPAKVPDEFLLPDKTLGMMNMATASNRVARFTRWEDETRQAMATTALRADPRFERQPLQDGKFMAVVLPDPGKNPELKKLITDVGCDGGWCTRGEEFAMDYGSSGSRLHVIVSGEGKQARPAAQFAVETKMQRGSNNGVPFEIPNVSITEIKTVGNTRDFQGEKHRASLPAIQQYVQALDKQYGGIRIVDPVRYSKPTLSELGMIQLPKDPMDLLIMGVDFKPRKPLAEKFGTEYQGLKAVRDEVVKLNNGSQYMTGNEDDIAELVRQATRNVLTPQQRAAGGMIERQSTDNRRYL